MRAKKINEIMFDDDASNKALSGWSQMYMGDSNFSKTIVVNEPFKITFDRKDEYAKLAFILQKHRVPFEEFEPETVTEILKFSDGMEFDTSGELRMEEREDGWYVVGNGTLIPVNSPEEGKKYLNKNVRTLLSK